MRRRKPPVRKTERRSRTATTSRTGDAAWKKAERDVARYFGTERTGLGRAGHDLQEVPTVAEWLKLRAPEMIFAEGAAWAEPYRYIFADSKCHKTLLPTLEQWHSVVDSNPDKKHLKPVLILGPNDGDLGSDKLHGFIGLCRLEDFPQVYRTFLAYPGAASEIACQIPYRFWMIRKPSNPTKLVVGAVEQALNAGIDWKTKKTGEAGPQFILPLAYLYYPKRITPALAFSLAW